MDNYIFVLFFSVLAIATIGFIYSDYDIIEPVNIFNFTTLFSIGMSTLYVYKWNLYVSVFTCLLIIIGVLSFTLGGCIVDKSLKLNSAANFFLLESFVFRIKCVLL